MYTVPSAPRMMKSELHPAEHHRLPALAARDAAHDPADPHPRRRERLVPVVLLHEQEVERVAVGDLVDAQVDQEPHRHQADAQPAPAPPPRTIAVPLGCGLRRERRHEHEPIDARQGRERAEDPGQPPALVARRQERAEEDGQEDGLGIGDVKHVGGGEDEEEPGRIAAHRPAELAPDDTRQQRSDEQAGDRRDHEAGDQRVAGHGIHRSAQPRVEREEDDEQRHVARTASVVAVARQIEVVRRVPPVPDLQDLAEIHDLLVVDGDERDDAEDEHPDLDEDGQTDEAPVVIRQAQARHGPECRRSSACGPISARLLPSVTFPSPRDAGDSAGRGVAQPGSAHRSGR